MSNPLKYRFLEIELISYKEVLGKAADTVLDEDVSQYPIFVAHQEEVQVGIPIIERGKVKGNWSINISSLEEFVVKQLIEVPKIDDFRKVYKDPKQYLCFFVLSELGATFNFIPR